MQEGERHKMSGGEVQEGENGGGESQGGVAEMATTLTQTMTEDMDYAIVLMVCVRLATALRVPLHQSRVYRCPDKFPAGYYWYGGRRKGPGCPPKWVELLL